MNSMHKIPFGTPCGGLITALIGVIIAVLLIFIGFWKTLLIAVLGGVGYLLGASQLFCGDVKDALNRVIPQNASNPQIPQKKESDDDQ